MSRTLLIASALVFSLGSESALAQASRAEVPHAPFLGGIVVQPTAPAPPAPTLNSDRAPFLPTPTGVPFAAGDPGSEAAPSIEAYSAFQLGHYLSALRLAEPLANLGDPAAQTLLGEIYSRGLGVARDEEEAARWYGIAAKSGVAEAQFRYAMMIIEGQAAKRDDAEARDLMKSAADAGNPQAAFNYGQMLIQASPTGGFAEAVGYFRKAADAGLPDAEYAMSQLYAYGRGVGEAKPDEARRWLGEAARSGHETAQIEFGIWLINGRGGEADPVEGFRWLKGAAERGNPIAVNRVAHLYKDGVGTPRNPTEAAKWVILARRAKNSDPVLDTFFKTLSEPEQKAALEAANRFRAS